MHALHSMSLRTFIGGSIFVITGGYVLFSIMSTPGAEEFRMGQRVFNQMIAEETLQSGGFYEAYPEGMPSDFVAFLETEQGARFWPVTISEYHRRERMNFENQGIKGRFLIPDALSFSAHRPDFSAGKQLVYIPHDADGLIELQGHNAPDAAAIFIKRLPFPSESRGINLR